MKVHWLILPCLAVVGCAPPYIEELDSAVAATRQMTLVTTLGPLTQLDNDVTGTRFLPVKPDAAASTIDMVLIQSGFLVSDRPGVEELTFLSNSGGNLQNMSAPTPASFSLSGADPNYPLYEYDVTATTTTANIVVLFLDGSSTTYQSFTADSVSGPLQSVSSPTVFTGMFGGGAVSAARDIPLLAAPYDNFSFFVNVSGTNIEYTVGLSNGVFSGISVMNSGLALPGAGNRILYYWNGLAATQSLSYASYNVAGQWVCYRWNTSPMPVLLPKVTSRIDAVLTTGELLSTQGGTMRVYDSGGSTEATVPIGALQFCYEAYVGGTPYVFFSLSLKLSQGDWAFRVYAIPTTSLGGLRG